MSSSTVNTYRQYKQGTQAMFTWLSESLDEFGIAFDKRVEDASIRGEKTHRLLAVVFHLLLMNKNDNLLTHIQASWRWHLKRSAWVL